MNEPQAIFRYGGYAADGPCSYTLVGRRQPGIIHANFILAAPIPKIADFTISYGNSFVTLPDCRLRRQTIATNRSGRWRQCVFEDRRWAWPLANIYGEYNSYRKGVFVEASRKTLAELCSLCLAAIGETANVGNLPAIYPTVNFNGNKAILELEKLLDSVGFELMAGYNRDLRIFKRGVGQQINLSDTRIMENSVSYEPAIIPRTTIVESLDTFWQEDIPLEAIGYERDGTQKPIDELSYAPSGGFQYEDLDTFNNVTDADLRELCKTTIYKHFRPIGPIELKKPANITQSSTVIDSFFKVNKGEEWRILPLNNFQLSLYPVDSESVSSKRVKPSQLIGYFFNEKYGHRNNATFDDYENEDIEFSEGNGLDNGHPEWIWSEGFSLDVESGLVVTSKPAFWLYRGSSDTQPERRDKPKLFLRTSFPLRNPANRSTIRQWYTFIDNSGVNGLQELIQPSQLLYEVGRTQETIAAEFISEAGHYMQQELAQRIAGPSYFVPFKGLCLDLQTDGLMRAISINKSAKGEATTLAEWNVDNPTRRTTYKQKREQDQTYSAIDSYKRESEKLKRKGAPRVRKVQ
jgi:hypothetical protein